MSACNCWAPSGQGFPNPSAFRNPGVRNPGVLLVSCMVGYLLIVRVCVSQVPESFPNDPVFQQNNQNYLKDPAVYMGALNAQKSWAITTGIKPLPIALLGRGCNNQVTTVFPNNELPYPRVQSTAVLGATDADTDLNAAKLAVATTNNALEGAGVCWTCSTLCISVLHLDTLKVTATTLAKGIDVVIKNGIKIAAVLEGTSLEDDDDIYLLDAALRKAEANGVLVISTTGFMVKNEICDMDTNYCESGRSLEGHYPARLSHPNLLTVAEIWKALEYTSPVGATSVDIFVVLDPIQADGLKRGVFGPALVAAMTAMFWGMRPCLDWRRVKHVILTHACSCTNPIDTTIANRSGCGGTADMLKAVLTSQYFSCTPRTNPSMYQWAVNTVAQLLALKRYAITPPEPATSPQCTALLP